MKIQPEFPNSRLLDLKDPKDVESFYYCCKAKEAILAIPREQRPNTVKNCLICGKLAENLGTFLPDAAFQKRIGGRPDKQRVIPYGVCDVCVEDPNTPSRVEDMVLHDLQVQ